MKNQYKPNYGPNLVGAGGSSPIPNTGDFDEVYESHETPAVPPMANHLTPSAGPETPNEVEISKSCDLVDANCKEDLEEFQTAVSANGDVYSTEPSALRPHTAECKTTDTVENGSITREVSCTGTPTSSYDKHPLDAARKLGIL
jgi:hypothetical protein